MPFETNKDPYIKDVKIINMKLEIYYCGAGYF